MKFTITSSLLGFKATVTFDYNLLVTINNTPRVFREVLKENSFRWNPIGKNWYTEMYYAYYRLCQILADNDTQYNLQYATNEPTLQSRNFKELTTFESESGMNLRSYQIAEVNRLAMEDFAICGFGMRTGKSAIFSKLADLSLNRVVIVVPNSLVISTLRNVSEWMKSTKSVGLYDAKKLKKVESVNLNHDINIIPYSMVGKVGTRILWDKGSKYYVIVDEVQKCSKTGTLRGKGLKAITNKKHVSCVHWFTGTLYNNYSSELVGMLDNMNLVSIVSPLSKFRTEMLGQELEEQVIGYGRNKRTITTWSKPSSDEEYTCKLRKFLDCLNYHRLTKEDVRDELPDMIHNIVPVVDFTYTKKEQEWLLEEDFSEGGNLFEMSRKYALKKVKSAEFKEFFLDHYSKTIVVYRHTEVLEEMQLLAQENSITYCTISGDTDDVQVEVDKFQDGDKQLIFLQGSMVEGLTLHSATEMFMVELPFTKGELDQTVDRLWSYDIEDIKTVYYLVDDQGVDTRKLEILRDKSANSNAYENHNVESII